MKHYTANFASKTISRSSNADYRFAWLITSTTGFEVSGFSTTKENATKTANRAVAARNYKAVYGEWAVEIIKL